MPTIPSGTKFMGVSPNVPTPENRSALSNSYQEFYTIDDIIATTGTDDFYNLNGTMSSNRTVNLDNKFVTFTNGNFGIGEASPFYRLHATGSNGALSSDLDNVDGFGVDLKLTTTNTNTRTRIGVIEGPYSLSLGLRGSTDVISPGFGQQTDCFVYASAESNGLNIINASGTGTQDYIRLYAGNTALSTSHIHIQGSGATKGNVGIGTESPAEKLDVVGKVKAQTVQLTTGAAANRYLVSDASENGSWVALPTAETIAASDETTALTTGTAKVTFRMPYAMTLTEVRASLTTAQTSGNIFTVDINEGGNSILSTKLTIDNTEKTSVTAATPAVISDAALADNAEITIDIDQIGDGTAKGLKVTLIGTRA